mmetsp:Transcript_75332/g.244978  ORF Transcript_75332/g.244978 Transcript_75332/m.244978 type:complete len:338 (+) Transcript_75332:1447-2460(+)
MSPRTLDAEHSVPPAEHAAPTALKTASCHFAHQPLDLHQVLDKFASSEAAKMPLAFERRGVPSLPYQMQPPLQARFTEHKCLGELATLPPTACTSLQTGGRHSGLSQHPPRRPAPCNQLHDLQSLFSPPSNIEPAHSSKVQNTAHDRKVGRPSSQGGASAVVLAQGSHICAPKRVFSRQSAACACRCCWRRCHPNATATGTAPRREADPLWARTCVGRRVPTHNEVHESIGHALHELRQPRRSWVARRAQIDLQKPRLQILVDHHIEAVQLEASRSLHDGVLHGFQAVQDNGLDLGSQHLAPIPVPAAGRPQLRLESREAHHGTLRHELPVLVHGPI